MQLMLMIGILFFLGFPHGILWVLLRSAFGARQFVVIAVQVWATLYYLFPVLLTLLILLSLPMHVPLDPSASSAVAQMCFELT